MEYATFYHFTSVVHLPYILAAGQLGITESNISMTTNNAGPDVLWLSTRSRFNAKLNQLGLYGSAVDKTQVRFELSLPTDEVKPWFGWSRRQGIEKSWYQALNNAASGGAKHWAVIERPVPVAEWVSVIDMHTGELLVDLDTIIRKVHPTVKGS